MRSPSLILASLMIASAAGGQTLDRTLAEIAAVRQLHQAAISPDGSRVAYVEALPAPGKSAIYTDSLPSASGARVRVSAGDGKSAHDERTLACTTDGKQLAFLSAIDKYGQHQ